MRTYTPLLSALAVLAPGLAHAEGPFSGEIELLRPAASGPVLLGVDTATADRAQPLRMSLGLQYEQNPLILYTNGEFSDRVVASREIMDLAVAYTVAPRVQVRGSIPVAVQWGSTSDEYEADGFGVGDLMAGVHVAAVQSEHFTTGPAGDLLLPTGSRRMYLGEATPRFRGQWLVSGGAGPFLAGGSIGFEGRTKISTDADLDYGTSLLAGFGARFQVVPQLSALASVVGRFGVPFGKPGTATSEVVAGVDVRPIDNWSFVVGGGHGLSRGVGATDMRVLGTATFTPPKKPEPEPEPEIAEIEKPPPPEIEDIIVPPAPEPEWKPEQLARVTARHIEIRDPIQFELDTDRILPESKPTLEYVARLLEGDPDIIHVVIVGHASEEGSFKYNYELSETRARAVFEALLDQGVHPDRLSYRSMGEIQPVVTGAAPTGTPDEAALAKNRRVEFQIVRVKIPGEADPVYAPVDKLPWSGDARPKPPEGIAPPPDAVPTVVPTTPSGGTAPDGATGKVETPTTPAVDAPPPKLRSLTVGSATVVGDLDVIVATKAIQAISPQIEACYLDPRLNIVGQITADVGVGPAGEILTHSTSGSTFAPETNVATCIDAALLKLTFPALGDGKTAAVRYPLLFTPPVGGYPAQEAPKSPDDLLETP